MRDRLQSCDAAIELSHAPHTSGWQESSKHGEILVMVKVGVSEVLQRWSRSGKRSDLREATNHTYIGYC